MRISDWSSDVCSSDLFDNGPASPYLRPLDRIVRQLVYLCFRHLKHLPAKLCKVRINVGIDAERRPQADHIDLPHRLPAIETERPFFTIGRAAWRERGGQSV